MTTISANGMTDQLLAVLREAFEGAAQPFFTDGTADTAMLGTLANLSGVEASRRIAGSSVAAHANHVAFGLRASTAWITGDRRARDWQESWQVATVDDAGWSRLQQEVRAGYEELKQAIESHGASDAEASGAAVFALAHVAYHLGAVRQKVVCISQETR